MGYLGLFFLAVPSGKMMVLVQVYILLHDE
jgi:hypothetical protein